MEPHVRGDKTPILLSAALTLGALGLAYLTIQLPFVAGSPLRDLLAPLGAIVLGTAGSWLAFEARRRTTGSGRVALLVLGLFAALVAVAAILLLVLIFGLCGLYWTRSSC